MTNTYIEMARENLERAVSSYTDAPVQWSASAPVTYEVLPYAENLVPNPLPESTDGFTVRGDLSLADGWLTLTHTASSGAAYVGQTNIPVTPGEWFGWGLDVGWGDGIGRARIQLQFHGGGGSIESPQLMVDFSDMPDGGRVSFSGQVPEGAETARVYLWGYLEGTTNAPPVGSTITTRRWRAVTADTKSEALAMVAEYADGDHYGWEWDGEPHASTSHRPEQPAPRTNVTWLDPVTGVAREWSAGVGGSVDVVTRNLVANPSYETGTSGLLSGSGVPRTVYTGASSAVAAGDYAVNIETVGASGSSGWVAQNLTGSPEPGQWVAMSTATRRSTGATHAVHRFNFRDESGSILSTVGSAAWELTTLPNAENPRNTFAAQVPPGTHSITANVRLHGSDSGFSAPDDGWTNTDAWLAAIADTQDEALAMVSDYFDGDTPEHRADNIIYRYDWEGTPHASASTETALGQGWHEIVDPSVQQATQDYNDATSSKKPKGWDEGCLYSELHDAVFVPGGLNPTIETEEFNGFSTLVIQNMLTDHVFRYSVEHPVRLPPMPENRFVRATLVEGNYDGPIFDGDDEDTIDDQYRTLYIWEDEPHNSPSLMRKSFK